MRVKISYSKLWVTVWDFQLVITSIKVYLVKNECLWCMHGVDPSKYTSKLVLKTHICETQGIILSR